VKTVVIKVLFCTVAHNCHGKIILTTAKSFLSRQNHFGHGKIIFVTAKSFSPRQNHFRHGKIILTTAKSFSGLEITAGQWTMSGLIGELTGQPFVLPVMLSSHIRSY